jgi:hypothetical protein
MTFDFERSQRLSLRLRTGGPRAVRPDEVDNVYTSPTLVGLPDGRSAHLIHVLEGQWLTQRVRTSTADRSDLWVSSALAPLVTVLVEGDLPLAAGGRLANAEFFHPALIGPPGWLPEIGPLGLIGLRLVEGAIEVAAVDPPVQTPAEQQRVRALLARHLRNAAEWYDDGIGNNRRLELTRAVSAALLEEPDLFREPWLPFDELLHDPLREDHARHWRDLSARWQDGATSFSIADMPEALFGELSRRAPLYGMSMDQYVIALLGHLAWRTPFAEDMGPWESWAPEPSAAPTNLRSIR